MTSITIQSTVDEAKRAISKIAREFDYDQIKSTKWTISYKIPSSGFSWGNTLQITISEKSNGCLVKAVSESSSQIQIIDWGKNTRIEEEFISELEYLLT